MEPFSQFFTPKNALLSGANSPNLNSLERFRRTMPPTESMLNIVNSTQVISRTMKMMKMATIDYGRFCIPMSGVTNYDVNQNNSASCYHISQLKLLHPPILCVNPNCYLIFICDQWWQTSGLCQSGWAISRRGSPKCVRTDDGREQATSQLHQFAYSFL